MKNRGKEIKELLCHILNKLEEVEQKIERQEEDIRNFLADRDSSYEPSSLLIAQQKSTRTSLELLREEIQELHQVISIIMK